MPCHSGLGVQKKENLLRSKKNYKYLLLLESMMGDQKATYSTNDLIQAKVEDR